MPLVSVYIGSKVADQVDESFMDTVRMIIADVLSCSLPNGENGTLNPSTDLEVYSHSTGPLDYTTIDLLLDIEAMPYPARAVNQQERGDAIKRRVSSLLNGGEVAVWLKLPPVTWS